MVRAARYGKGWMPYMYTTQMLRDSIEKIAGIRDDLTDVPVQFEHGLFIFVSSVQIASKRSIAQLPSSAPDMLKIFQSSRRATRSPAPRMIAGAVLGSLSRRAYARFPHPSAFGGRRCEEHSKNHRRGIHTRVQTILAPVYAARPLLENLRALDEAQSDHC
jgi:hypothetical protein